MKYFALVTTALHLGLSAGESREFQLLKATFANSLFKDEVFNRRVKTRKDKELHGRHLEAFAHPKFINNHRRFVAVNDEDTLAASETEAQACDAAFLSCLKNDKCVSCFLSLQDKGIDWASVPPHTPCPRVTEILFEGKHCLELQGNGDALDAFCNAFDSCVIWEDQTDPKGATNATLNCDSLTECKWDGMHTSFLGDGICHNGVGCYNHEICGYDKGDCCEDTCNDKKKFAGMECGTEGYACKDPNSEKCDSSLTAACTNGDSDDPIPEPIDCDADKTLYRLTMYDSFGDGWDETKLTITPKDDASKVLFQGGLTSGSQGTEFICLSTAPDCYHVTVAGGVWGNEVSWEFTPGSPGSPAVANGLSPMDCEFSVGGEVCIRTCNGKANKDVSHDPEYRTYKEMINCMSDKCIIQMGTCSKDSSCVSCLKQDAPEYCFANDNFNAVIDCGLCHCAKEDDVTEYCKGKLAPGAVPPVQPGKQSSSSKPCSSAETLQGSSAVLSFSECSNIEQIGMMVTDFNENNFGALDAFESCSHSYKGEPLHGGKTALGCMQFLVNAIKDPTDGIENPDAPADAIKALAEAIYHNAEDFCDCASSANTNTPLCPSFQNFKTLLFETLDACQALDEIDCDAWAQFYSPCKSNIEQKFGKVDFSKKEQCVYVQSECGRAGPFPAFRKLDCINEIPAQAWDFYKSYSTSCVQDGGDIPSTPSPTQKPDPKPTGGDPSPLPTPSPTAPKAGPKPYVPSDVQPNRPTKPYKPAGDNGGKRGHFWRNLIIVVLIVGAAYWYYKRQTGAFDFVHYRRARNYAGDNEMYSSLAMESGSSSFEPPSLPPTPMAVGGDMS